MYKLNGRTLNPDEGFQHEGTSYPQNWLRLTSLEEKQAIGITEEPDVVAPWYDQRFYWGVDNPKLLNDREESDEQGNPMYVQVFDPTVGEHGAMVNSTERLVTRGMKHQWIAQFKQAANSMLAQTDWVVTRKAERNVDIPADIAAKRAAVVAECARLEAAITAAQDVPALIAVIGSANWG
jgi:hypothetical protein